MNDSQRRSPHLKRAWVAMLCALLAREADAQASHTNATAAKNGRGPLDLRADSLLARLLVTPGRITSDGHVYSFHTNQRLLDDLAALDLHAVPQLIECMSDSAPSVTYRDGDDEAVLRGAVCFEALTNTWFFRMHDESLLWRVEMALDCAGLRYPGTQACYGGYMAGAEELRRVQTVWRNYLSLFHTEKKEARPHLRYSAIGCYNVKLRATTPTELAVVDTTRALYFELDSLPLPGTVRPTHVRLSDELTLGGDTRWRLHYEAAIYVHWFSEHGQAGDPGLTIGFGGNDSVQTGYVLYPRGGGPGPIRNFVCEARD